MGVKHDGNDGLTRKVKRRRGRPYKVQAPLDVSRDYGYVTKKKLDTWLNYWIAKTIWSKPQFKLTCGTT